jgi:ubiquinone/menaquinone biosynthesis C-methylase UbiE
MTKIPFMEINCDEYLNKALWYKALADSLRVQVLRVLQHHSFGALELARIFDIRQNSMSHHLKLLVKAGLLETKREGTSIFYRRSAIGNTLTKAVFVDVDNLVLPSAVSEQRALVFQERISQAKDFFEKNASLFRKKQDLIAEYNQYGELAESILARCECNQTHAIELGCGLGEFLEPLSQRFEQVSAVDISASMIANARQNVNKENITFIVGELDQIEQKSDAIVCNMVLHHLPDPKMLFQQAANALNDNGVLLITDLCEHQNEWAKTSCGDLWLGFDQQQLIAWADEHNLAVEQQGFLALRNGFQVQSLLFRLT